MTEKFTSKRVAGITTMSGGSENDDHPIVPTNIPTTSYFNDNMVTMTGAIGSPEILII